MKHQNHKGAARGAAPLARVDGLEPQYETPTAERQAIFLGSTEPRAARSQKAAVGLTVDRPVVGVVNGPRLHRETTYLLSRHRAP